eukprot:175236_1
MSEKSPVIEKPIGTRPPLFLLCFDLSPLPPVVLAPFFLIGHTVFSLIYSILKEKVFDLKGFAFPACNTAICMTMFLLCAALELSARKNMEFKMNAFFWEYVAVGVTAGFISDFFVNMALLYITYPARIVLGSSKIFIVMIARVIMMKKRYWYTEYLNVLVLLSGIVFVVVADKRKQTSGEYTPNPLAGGLCMMVAVMSDVFSVIFTEKVLCKKRHCSSAEILFFSSLVAVVISVVFAFAKGEVGPAIEHAKIMPEGVWYTLIFAPVNYFSTIFTFLVIAQFGSFQSEVVKSIRKVFQIAASFCLVVEPPKVFTLFHGVGMSLFGWSLVVGSLLKYFKTKSRKQAAGGGSFSMVKPAEPSKDQPESVSLSTLNLPVKQPSNADLNHADVTVDIPPCDTADGGDCVATTVHVEGAPYVGVSGSVSTVTGMSSSDGESPNEEHDVPV